MNKVNRRRPLDDDEGYGKFCDHVLALKNIFTSSVFEAVDFKRIS
jgi:hypothetical protein